MKPRKLVCGVGINDAGYDVSKYGVTDIGGKQKRKQVWICPYYQTWQSMLVRCFSTKFQERNPTYKACNVTEEWLTFSAFKNWMMDQDWEGLQLDKDLLFEGNKVYGPETCIFVTQMVNTFANASGSARGEFLTGASWHKPMEKFLARCRNPFTSKLENLGYFSCEQEAHQVWWKRKQELAHELAVIQPDPRVAKALIDRYSNYSINCT